MIAHFKCGQNKLLTNLIIINFCSQRSFCHALCLSITAMYIFLCTYTSAQTLPHYSASSFPVFPRQTRLLSQLFVPLCVLVTHRLLSSYCSHPDCVFEVVSRSFYEFVFMFVHLKLDKILITKNDLKIYFSWCDTLRTDFPHCHFTSNETGQDCLLMSIMTSANLFYKKNTV